MKYLILLSFLLSSVTYAGEQKYVTIYNAVQNVVEDVKYLKQGEQAPFTGYLFSPEKEQELRLMDSDYKYLEKVNLSLTNMNKYYEANETVMNARIDNQSKQIDTLTSRVAKTDNTLLSIGMFVLGAVVAGGIAVGVTKVVK